MINNLYGFNITLNRGGLAGLRKKGGECLGCNTGQTILIDSMSVKFEGDYWSGDLSVLYHLKIL